MVSPISHMAPCLRSAGAAPTKHKQANINKMVARRHETPTKAAESVLATDTHMEITSHSQGQAYKCCALDDVGCHTHEPFFYIEGNFLDKIRFE